MSHSKGFARERELVNQFDDAGFAATRVPNSGGGTKRDLPDILAGNQGDIYAIEAKARSNGHVYLEGEEVESLLFFARGFGARPRVAVRFDYEDWYFFHPGDTSVHVTDGGNYRIKKETALAAGTPFDDFVNPSDKVTLK